MKQSLYRICTFIIVSVLIFVPGTALSADNSCTEQEKYAYEFLAALDVLPFSGDASEVDMNANLTRSEFAEMMVKICGHESVKRDVEFIDVQKDHKRAEYIYEAVSLGLMNGYSDKTFRPDYPVSYEEAVKVAVTALGYGKKAELSGTYPESYILEAKRIGLLKNVEGKKHTFITIGSCNNLIVNMLHIPMLETSQIASDKVVVNNENEKNLLERNLEVYSFSGLVTETERSALTGISTLSKGEAIIGDKLFKSMDSKVENWLGYYVNVYYKDENEILFIWPEKFEELQISAKDILYEDGKFSTEQFVWLNNGKKCIEKLNPYADLIFNGVSVGAFKKDDMLLKQGYVKLLDNNNDGKFDVIFVNEYFDMVVGMIADRNFIVTDREDSSLYLDLNDEDDNKLFTIEEQGKEITAEDISVNDVISVFKSKNSKGRTYYKAVVSDKYIKGCYDSKSEDTIEIDGISYEVSDYFNSNCSNVRMGTEGRFLLNYEGRITSLGDVFEGDLLYGYIIGGEICSTRRKTIEFKLLADSGNIEYYETAEKVVVDGTAYRNNDVSKLIDTDIMKVNGELRQLVKYRLDSEGKIKELDTVAGSEEGGLSLDIEKAQRRFYRAFCGFGVNKSEFAIDVNNTKVFFIPSSEQYKGEDEAYLLTNGNYITDKKNCIVSAYDLDDLLIAKVIVIEEDPNEDIVYNDARAFMVDKIRYVCDEDDEWVRELTGVQYGAVSKVYIRDEELVTDVKQGDIVILAKDYEGYVVKIDKVLSPKDPFGTVIRGSNPDKYYSSLNGVYGALVAYNGGKVVVSGTNPDSLDLTTRYPFFSNEFTVTIYDAENETVKVSSMNELSNYLYNINSSAKIFVCTRVGYARDIFVMDLD